MHVWPRSMNNPRKKIKGEVGDGGGDRSLETMRESNDVLPKCIIHFSKSTCTKVTQLSEESFNKLQDILRRRMMQPEGSPYRMSEICLQIPISYSEKEALGYHGDCYQFFTGNLNRLKHDEIPSTSRLHRKTSNVGIIFPAECIFCDKKGRCKVKRKGAWTTEPLAKFEFGGGETVLKTAESENDYLLLKKIKGFDLFACEAQYHPSCHKNYTRKTLWLSTDESNVSQQTEMELTHQNAFHKVCAVIEDKIINRQDLVLLKDLKVEYTAALEGTPFANPRYRLENLMAKIMKRYGKQLSFLQLGGTKFNSSVVYASSSRLDTFAQKLYELSSTEKINDAALQLHANIIQKFKESGSTVWPPTAKDLEHQDDVLPRDLEKFIFTLITGDVTSPLTAKNSRLVQSLGQDLCRAATRGQWKETAQAHSSVYDLTSHVSKQ